MALYCLVDISSDIFYSFSVPGRGEREEASEEVAGETYFSVKNRGSGGGSREGGAGGEVRRGDVCGEGGCWIFFFGPKSPPRLSGKKKETKPKLFGPDIFRWDRGLPREGVGAKKFGMSLETQGKQNFWRDVPGFFRDFSGICRGRPGSLRKRSLCSIFVPLQNDTCRIATNNSQGQFFFNSLHALTFAWRMICTQKRAPS